MSRLATIEKKLDLVLSLLNPAAEQDEYWTAREAMEHLGYSNQAQLKADHEAGFISRRPRDGRQLEYKAFDVKARKKQLDELKNKTA